MNQITDEQLEEFNNMFGDVLPDYVHEPIKFMFYWNMFVQIKDNESYTK
jgi:hypothetical protein